MCESYTNIDGRYDKNRALDDGRYYTNKNFNLLNHSYNQHNNFFTFNGVNTNIPVV